MTKQKNIYAPGNKVNTKEFKDNWEKTFGKKQKESTEQEVRKSNNMNISVPKD